MWLSLDLFGSRKQLFQRRARELLALDHVRQAGTDGHKKSSFPASLGPDLKEPGATAPPSAFYRAWAPRAATPLWPIQYLS